MAFPVDKIISGGQTGADRAALDVALQLGIPAGGWCPAGRRAEDGVIPARYPLTETKSPIHSVRTRRNVREADGTLIFNTGVLDGGTLLTVNYANQRGKPCLLVQLDDPGHPDVAVVRAWIAAQRIRVLNVAGPRESKRAGIYGGTRGFLFLL
ncbi:MAG: putative molybdenum carrier protein [Desulfuromonadales bacterium]|nr:putative molybdenum carrier protein [Desulfuromonadales bacterium]